MSNWTMRKVSKKDKGSQKDNEKRMSMAEAMMRKIMIHRA